MVRLKNISEAKEFFKKNKKGMALIEDINNDGKNILRSVTSVKRAKEVFKNIEKRTKKDMPDEVLHEKK